MLEMPLFFAKSAILGKISTYHKSYDKSKICPYS